MRRKMPRSLRQSSSALLLLPGKCPFAESGQTDFSLHRLAVGIAGVSDNAFNLAGDFDREFDLAAFDRSGQVEFAEQAFVSASQLLPLLFEGEAGIARAGFGLDRDAPCAGHVNLVAALVAPLVA